MLALEVKDLVKFYGELKALDSVSFQVENGEIFGLLGPNGAGKTTLMEIIAGIRNPTSGTIKVFGLDALKDRKEVSKLIGFNPQETMLYDDLTGMENLEFAASLYNMDRSTFKSRLDDLADLMDVKGIIKKRVGKLSGGQKRRISIIASIIHEPRLLILDEPTVGLDPEARRDFWRIIWKLRDSGSTILLSTHYMEEADELCDRVAIMEGGRIIAIGRPDDLKRKYGGRAKILIYPKLKLLSDTDRLLRNLGYSTKRIVDSLVIEEDEPSELVPHLISEMSERGMRPERVEIRTPTLEDVFLNLTGKPLSEVM